MITKYESEVPTIKASIESWHYVPDDILTRQTISVALGVGVSLFEWQVHAGCLLKMYADRGKVNTTWLIGGQHPSELLYQQYDIIVLHKP